MGIQGLLKQLGSLLGPGSDAPLSSPSHQEAHEGIKCNIREFAGRTLAVDASSWLHKAGYACAERLVESIESGRPDAIAERTYCNYILSRCDELLTFAQIRHLVLVFDGRRCPLKAVTNQEREAKRKANLVEARKLKNSGQREKAQEKYKACIRVTDDMAQKVAQAVKKNQRKKGLSPPENRISCLFSPYEADAQLARICVDGIADAVITEDSDVMVYSAVCNVPFPIIYKLDRNNGACDVITMDWLFTPSHKQSSSNITRHLLSPVKKKPGKKKSSTSGGALHSSLKAMEDRESRLPGSGVRMFVQACVLSGCDYAPSRLKGVGIVKAFRLVIENAHRDANTRFHHILKSLPRGAISPNNEDTLQKDQTDLDAYEEILSKSEAVFFYHCVLCQQSGKVVSLVQPSELGECLPSEILGQGFWPSVDRFDSDLSFVGSLTVPSRDEVGFPSLSANLLDRQNWSKEPPKRDIDPANCSIKHQQNDRSSFFHQKTTNSQKSNDCGGGALVSETKKEQEERLLRASDDAISSIVAFVGEPQTKQYASSSSSTGGVDVWNATSDFSRQQDKSKNPFSSFVCSAKPGVKETVRYPRNPYAIDINKISKHQVSKMAITSTQVTQSGRSDSDNTVHAPMGTPSSFRPSFHEQSLSAQKIRTVSPDIDALPLGAKHDNSSRNQGRPSRSPYFETGPSRMCVSNVRPSPSPHEAPRPTRSRYFANNGPTQTIPSPQICGDKRGLLSRLDAVAETPPNEKSTGRKESNNWADGGNAISTAIEGFYSDDDTENDCVAIECPAMPIPPKEKKEDHYVSGALGDDSVSCSMPSLSSAASRKYANPLRSKNSKYTVPKKRLVCNKPRKRSAILDKSIKPQNTNGRVQTIPKRKGMHGATVVPPSAKKRCLSAPSIKEYFQPVLTKDQS